MSGVGGAWVARVVGSPSWAVAYYKTVEAAAVVAVAADDDGGCCLSAALFRILVKAIKM